MQCKEERWISHLKPTYHKWLLFSHCPIEYICILCRERSFSLIWSSIPHLHHMLIALRIDPINTKATPDDIWCRQYSTWHCICWTSFLYYFLRQFAWTTSILMITMVLYGSKITTQSTWDCTLQQLKILSLQVYTADNSLKCSGHTGETQNYHLFQAAGASCFRVWVSWRVHNISLKWEVANNIQAYCRVSPLRLKVIQFLQVPQQYAYWCWAWVNKHSWEYL